MQILGLHRGYRKVGANYGLPVFYVDVGLGVSYQPEELLRKLVTKGLKERAWVVFRNNASRERGIATVVGGLKFLKVNVEFEDDGRGRTPGWFPQVDRWLVKYVEDNAFNYGALRHRVDMLLYDGEDVSLFLEKTKDSQALRGVVAHDVDSIWETVKDHSIRVYEREEEIE